MGIIRVDVQGLTGKNEAVNDIFNLMSEGVLSGG